MKYWNKRRIARRYGLKEERSPRLVAKRESPTPVRNRKAHTSRNNQMVAALDALGSQTTRRMLARLMRGGAMSLSKLSEPFGITLPAAQMRLRVLEESGLVKTKKQGRVRICYYNPRSLSEIAALLSRRDAVDFLA